MWYFDKVEEALYMSACMLAKFTTCTHANTISVPMRNVWSVHVTVPSSERPKATGTVVKPFMVKAILTYMRSAAKYPAHSPGLTVLQQLLPKIVSLSMRQFSISSPHVLHQLQCSRAHGAAVATLLAALCWRCASLLGADTRLLLGVVARICNFACTS
jgi:hypothetical protein